MGDYSEQPSLIIEGNIIVDQDGNGTFLHNMPTPLERIAKLEAQVAALRKALHFYADFYENPNEGPWGVNSEDFGKVARKALEAKP